LTWVGDVTVVREVSIALSGLVVGASVIAFFRYVGFARKTPGPPGKRYALASWMVLTLGAFALFQGLVRALSVVEVDPLNWRDWGSLILQSNALLLLVVTIFSEKKWRVESP